MPLPSYVLFVDILGFGNLVMESGDLGVQSVSPSVRPEPAMQVRSHVLLSNSPALQRVFSFFHQTIEKSLPRIHKGTGGGTSLVFSDCAFLQTHEADEAGRIAIEIMREFISVRVPVRIGFAKGELRILRFQSDSYGSNINHSSQFLGPGVVRANRAEKCGAKGIRILVDPGAEADLIAAGVPLVEVSETDLKERVTKEINYLFTTEEYESGYDVMKSAFPTVDAYEDFVLTSHVVDMKKAAPQEMQHIYDRTAAALTRMRQQFGRPPVIVP